MVPIRDLTKFDISIQHQNSQKTFFFRWGLARVNPLTHTLIMNNADSSYLGRVARFIPACWTVAALSLAAMVAAKLLGG